MREEEIDKLEAIFYQEAPYDYILALEPKKQRGYRGACFYEEKVCRIFAPESYEAALFTMLHEIAHAIIQHKTHSDVWAKENVRLLKKYNYPKNLVERYAVMEPNLRQYVNS